MSFRTLNTVCEVIENTFSPFIATLFNGVQALRKLNLDISENYEDSDIWTFLRSVIEIQNHYSDILFSDN